MQSYEDPPPPYPGTEPHVVVSKGNYHSVPVHDVSSANVPVYNRTTYPQVTAVATGPTLIQTHAVRVGHNSVLCFCPYCRQQIVTRVDYDSGSFAWLMCLLLTVIGCVPCCVIPFCVTSCQDITHTCPHCSAVIGRRKIL